MPDTVDGIDGVGCEPGETEGCRPPLATARWPTALRFLAVQTGNGSARRDVLGSDGSAVTSVGEGNQGAWSGGFDGGIGAPALASAGPKFSTTGA